MEREHILRDALAQPTDAISYAITRRIHAHYTGKYVLYTVDGAFDLQGFVREGLAMMTPVSQTVSQIATHYYHKEKALLQADVNVWYEVDWKGYDFEMLVTHLQDGFHRAKHIWLIGADRSITEEFYKEVCAHSSEVRSEVLVFDQGCWHKSEELFKAIKASSFDNLILPQRLKNEIQNDFQNFLDSKETYHKYGLPWKRGALLTGPPGNGKTHTVKALVNQLGIPCLYIKSFASQYGTAQGNIHAAFEKARETTPCIMVLEDLDSLINEQSRAFFLNEMDGFAENDGIIVLATTNHPELLDVAMVERPSRFDRKYMFELPELDERNDYIAMWNAQVEPALKLALDDVMTIAEITDGFSFAFLKELFLSSMMRWISGGASDGMDAVMREQVEVLRFQMSSMIESRPELLLLDSSDDSDPFGE